MTARLRASHLVVLVAALAAALVIWLRVDARDRPPAVARRIDVRPLAPGGDGVALPLRPGSLRFAVIGDVGRGDRAQYDTARELAAWRERVHFTFVLMLGDNNYGGPEPEEYVRRFEQPYAPLLADGVSFHAALGNHDPPGEEHYAPYNMGGRRYYTFVKEYGLLKAVSPHRVQFFALDTVSIDRAQLEWLRRELESSTAEWLIAFYHHPSYTSARYGSDALRVRRALEPLFIRYGVDVGLAGHEHVYERIVPMSGVQYFTSGAGGALRQNDLQPASPITAAGFDADTHFMLFEIAGDDLYFQAVSRTGQTVDSGTFTRAIDPPGMSSVGK